MSNLITKQKKVNDIKKAKQEYRALQKAYIATDLEDFSNRLLEIEVSGKLDASNKNLRNLKRIQKNKNNLTATKHLENQAYIRGLRKNKQNPNDIECKPSNKQFSRFERLFIDKNIGK